MKTLKTIEELNRWTQQQSQIGFVPTMGALHEGHLKLVEKSMIENSSTLVSIFVNPTQFNNPNDLQSYPRTLEQDCAKLEGLGISAVFTPNKEELYADDYNYKVTELKESAVLEGAHRPGHFDGVLTVVLKLLMLSRCKKCYMGEKDYQQLLLIREMAKSLFLPVEIVGVPTVREIDGLAMSSRNSLLDSNSREKAPLIYKLLSSDLTNEEISGELTRAGFQVNYVEERWGRRLIAAEIGGVRLIDNV